MTSTFNAFVLNALSEGRSGFECDSPAVVQSHVIEFNHLVPELVGAHGLDCVGKAIWYLYSVASDTTHEALDPAADSTIDRFYDSIRVLYESGFCRFCIDRPNHADISRNSFATACFMLWDMDSGLNMTFGGRPELFRFGEHLIDFGLSHSHAACQESFLHCLGHLHFKYPQFVESKIDQFLQRRDIDGTMREYAAECRTGMIL